jgi:gluconolactonase
MVNYEGFKAELEIPEAVYRIDPQSGALSLVTDALAKPNGLCFSPDYSKLYVADTGVSPGVIHAFGVQGETRLGPGRELARMELDG